MQHQQGNGPPKAQKPLNPPVSVQDGSGQVQYAEPGGQEPAEQFPLLPLPPLPPPIGSTHVLLIHSNPKSQCDE